MNDKKVVLIIMDGVGIREEKYGNAVKLAKPKFLNKAIKKFPNILLSASQEAVGLPQGQIGNSEVGHQNIGAGRVVYQELMTINNSIKNGSFFDNKTLNKLFDEAKSKRKAVHILGIASDGCVHGSMEHIFAVMKLAKEKNFKRLYIHAITDGRDTLPNVAEKYIIDLSEKIREFGVGELVSVSGRYYAMDRESHYDRTKLAYNAIVLADAEKSINLIGSVAEKVKNGETDEFIKPIILDGYGGFKKGDYCLFTNFRADRARQLCNALADPSFKEFDVESTYNLYTMTSYSSKLDELGVPCVFEQKPIKNNLTEVVTNNGGKVLKIAETTKYAHVTYFLNGLNEREYEGETRILHPSDNVETFDLKPEMQAEKIAQSCIDAMNENKFSLIVLNFANGDMVGHTGNLEATKIAVKCVDEGIKNIYKNRGEYEILITADHGNAELMIDKDGQIITSHTLSPVPFIVCDKQYRLKSGDFALKNIAPTILDILGIEKPREMTGESLLK